MESLMSGDGNFNNAFEADWCIYNFFVFRGIEAPIFGPVLVDFPSKSEAQTPPKRPKEANTLNQAMPTKILTNHSLLIGVEGR